MGTGVPGEYKINGRVAALRAMGLRCEAYLTVGGGCGGDRVVSWKADLFQMMVSWKGGLVMWL